MHEDHQSINEKLFTTIDASRFFRGLPVITHALQIGDMAFQVDGIADSAALLDLPDFAKRFVDDNVAPYGMELWPASKMLARYVLAGEPGNGRCAIELGCGLGLVSIAAARCGWQVTATDNEPTSLAFARHNAKRNGARFASTKLLDWHKTDSERHYDCIFAADVLYERLDHQPLLACIGQLLTPSGSALVADPNRKIADSFQKAAESLGFLVGTAVAETYNHEGELVRGRIFRLSHGPTDGKHGPERTHPLLQ